MKAAITLLIAFFCLTAKQAQDNNLDTKPVTLDTLISFVTDHFLLNNPIVNEKKNNADKVINKHITFLNETTKENFFTEDKIIFQQAFKFLSKRLNKQDQVTIVTYSGQNGLLLEKASGINIKKMLYAIIDVKSNRIKKQSDGIALA